MEKHPSSSTNLQELHVHTAHLRVTRVFIPKYIQLFMHPLNTEHLLSQALS